MPDRSLACGFPASAVPLLRSSSRAFRSQTSRRGPRMNVLVTLTARLIDFNRYRPKLSVSNATLCNQGLSKVDDCLGRSLENHSLQAVVVIQVSMHGRHGQIMVVVLHACQSTGELALVVVVDIAESTHTILRGSPIHLRVIQRAAHEIAKRFGPAAVAFLLDQAVEGIRQFIIDRNRYAAHRSTSVRAVGLRLARSPVYNLERAVRLGTDLD